MKKTEVKKAKGKFDLEKMKVAKLKNIHLINGGNIFRDDFRTITDKIVKNGDSL